MSRSDKLFRRLDELEAEYQRLAAVEFERWLKGGWSRFLARMYGGPVWGKRWQSEDDSHFVRLEKEAQTLRTKLDQTMLDSPVGVVQATFEQLRGERASGTGDEFARVKSLLRSWNRPGTA